ncbi:hypothetical protein C8J57DRAFT_1655195 [Mycena rebaudengoi]|nr:hypothetical protein C8J57DRAFT_1655195 [Mycena rebaudengoi]
MAPLSTETGECTAHDEDTKEECDCTDYRESTTKPGRCAACYHRLRDHLVPSPQPEPSAGSSNDTQKEVDRILGRIVGDTTKKSMTVLKKSIASSSAATRRLLALSSRASAAHRESNEGMRPSDSGASSKGGKSSKGKGRKQDSVESLVKVFSVMVVPCGVEFDKASSTLVVPNDRTAKPDNIAIQTAMLNGLAVVEEVTGIEFDRTWTHSELVDFFRELLPHAFNYFLGLLENAPDGDDTPPWVLATAIQRHLQVVPVTYPSGRHIDMAVGSSSNGFRNNKIFIVSRRPIPDSILETWVSPDALIFKKAAAELQEAHRSPTPEPVPRRKKGGRLVSRSSSDEDEPPKKKHKVPEPVVPPRNGPAPFPPTLCLSSAADPAIIDLTLSTSNTVASQATSSGTKTEPTEPLSDDEEYDLRLPTLGNPYDKDQIFTFSL